jgi:hypothetical protein
MRPVTKSSPIDNAGNPLEIVPHDAAKADLCIELGTFCSFCEKYNSRSALHVEHIFAKGAIDIHGTLIYDHLKHRWDNFLLACVNCNSIKSNKDIAISNPYMPHLNNLLRFIEVTQGGLVKIKNGVAGVDLTRANAFIELVGLDRVPGHPRYSDKDDRWDNRLKVYDIASRQLKKYTLVNPATDLETIIDLAKTNGYFSIWYYIFGAFDDVKRALINGAIDQNGVLIRPFPGTHHPSFDAGNHYSTVLRP